MILLVVMCFYFISSFGVCKAVIKISEAAQEQRSMGFGFLFGFGFLCFGLGFFCLFCYLLGLFLRSGREHGKSRN